jgi:predicted AAA+ superfamily ATPase
VERSIINSLIKWQKSQSRMPLILLGARQIGKTYVLKEFGEKLFNKFHYFNFEENYDLQNIFQANISAIEIIEKLEINFRIKRSSYF